MSNNYTYLGYGCGRAVVKLNNQNIVVKVPYITYERVAREKWVAYMNK